jgi:phage gp36-like protein
MTYCTKADMISAYGEQALIELTDRVNAAVIVDAVLDDAVAGAEGEINLWIGGRYRLPLEVVPRSLKRIACDITRYILAGDVKEDDPIAIRYRSQIKVLQAVSKGHALLDQDSQGAAVVPVDTVQVSSGRTDFSDRSAW